MSLLASKYKNDLKYKNNPKFYDSWESLEDEIKAPIIPNKLDRYIKFARKKISFYKGRLAFYDKDALFPLKDVPVLTSNELRDLLPPRSSELIALPEKPISVFQSGGTTGSPKTTLFSHEELDLLDLPNARGFYALGLSADDRVANLFAVGGLYMTFIHINRMLQQFGCMNFPFSNHTSFDFIYNVTKLFKINCFAGIASVVMDYLRKIAGIGLDGINIEKVFYGGEHLYEADRKELEEKFRVKLIAAPGYGTVDTWYLGYQCLFCLPGIFHAHDDQAYMEIVNVETREHCRPDEVGVIYATPFCRRLTPIVRYLVGDKGMWLGEKCQCGRATPLFKLLGRGDDFLRIGFDFIDYNLMQEIVSQISGLYGVIQMEKKREDGKDKLVIRIESEAPSHEYADIAKILEEKLLSEKFSLRNQIEKGMVWPVKIELLAPGQIARNPRTGKLLRVIDIVH